MKKVIGILEKHWEAIEKFPDFSWIKKLTKTYPKAEICLVGGAIRDILLKKPDITDYDFVVRNIPLKKLESFLKTMGTVNLVGKTFGVYKFIHPKAKLTDAIDIALPRTEVATTHSGAHKDFDIYTDASLGIEEDLARRDFTINAIAWNVVTKKLFDPFFGIVDLDKKIINTVGIPKRRFEEDLARILRAVRFSATHSFTITPRVKKRIKELTPSLNKKIKGDFIVPREVIAKELIKTFVANPILAFDLYDSLGLTKELLPELLPMKKCPQPKAYHTEGDVWQHTKLALSKIGDKKFKQLFPKHEITPLIVFATLFHDIGKPSTLETPKKDGVDRIRNNNHDQVGGKMTREICERLKLSSYGEAHIDCDALVWCVRKHLLLVHGPIENIKNSTLEKYFFNTLVPGNVLLELFYTDGAATIPKDGNNLNALKTLLKRLKTLEPLVNKKRDGKQRGIITGGDLITHLKLKEGPLIGRLLSEIREAELAGAIKTKREALALARKLHKNDHNNR